MSNSKELNDLDDYIAQVMKKAKNALYEAIKKEGLLYIPSTLKRVSIHHYNSGNVAVSWVLDDESPSKKILVAIRHLEKSKDCSGIGFEVLICN